MGGFRGHTPRRAAPIRALPAEPAPTRVSRGLAQVAALGCVLALIATLDGDRASASPLQSVASDPVGATSQFASVPSDGVAEPDIIGDVDASFETGDLPPGTMIGPFGELTPIIIELPSSYAFDLDGLPQPTGSDSMEGKLPWFVRPVPFQVGGKFGLRFHPILHYWRMHNGVDMGGACGTPVVAAAAGQVSFAGWNGGYGNLVVIDHGMVNGYRMQTKYGHLSVIGVRAGQRVSVGDGIAKVGTTGLSTGCHLHFEVKLNGNYVNPEPFLNGKPSPTPTIPIQDLTPPTPVGLLTASLSPSPSRSESPTLSASPSPTASPSAKPSASASTSSSPPPTDTPTSSGSGTPPSSGTPSGPASPDGAASPDGSQRPEEPQSNSPTATGSEQTASLDPDAEG